VVRLVKASPARGAGIDNRSRYEREVKAAVAMWDRHVTALIEGREQQKVVPRTRLSVMTIRRIFLIFLAAHIVSGALP
jgi:hypothetical protein